jgi:mRNA-degrading endonuclease YafQ of YafQ-DinJ toxin-antitoxin module
MLARIAKRTGLKPDWLLIYRIQNDQLILVLTGSHGELFKK